MVRKSGPFLHEMSLNTAHVLQRIHLLVLVIGEDYDKIGPPIRVQYCVGPETSQCEECEDSSDKLHVCGLAEGLLVIM